MQSRVVVTALVALASVQCTGAAPATDPAPTTATEAAPATIGPTATSAPSSPAPSRSSPTAAAGAAVPGDVHEEVAGGRAPVTGLAVAGDDGDIDAVYAPGAGPDQPQPVWSVTKSVVSVLVGMAVDDGLLDVDTRLVDVVRSTADRHADVTIEHLLTMTSGIDLPDGDDTFAALHASDDWVASILDRPAATTPGAAFAYCSGCVHLLTAALHEVTGDAAAYAQERLFAPLGLADVRWSTATDGTGVPIGGWGLELTAAQMAEIGRLYLQGGRWDEEPLVPAEWVERSATPLVEPEPFETWQAGYGYLWWVHPAGAYAATGRGGQLLLVVPERSLVVAATAELSDADAHRSFTYVWDRVVRAGTG